jgi:argininosuccinate synthase
MLKAHRAMESITLDREVLALKDDLMPRYARMIYNGYWFSPERRLLQELIDASQAPVNGSVRVKLYKGTVLVSGRASKDSLFDPSIATFEDDKGPTIRPTPPVSSAERAADADRGASGRK